MAAFHRTIVIFIACEQGIAVDKVNIFVSPVKCFDITFHYDLTAQNSLIYYALARM